MKIFGWEPEFAKITDLWWAHMNIWDIVLLSHTSVVGHLNGELLLRLGVEVVGRQKSVHLIFWLVLSSFFFFFNIVN